MPSKNLVYENSVPLDPTIPFSEIFPFDIFLFWKKKLFHFPEASYYLQGPW